MRKVSAVLVVAIAMSVDAAAQQRTTIVHMNNPQTKVQQLPYTAEYKITKVQILANGTTISHESTETRARDAQGRTVNKTTRELTGGEGGAQVTVSIFDPEARTTTTWMVPGHTVTVMQRPAPGERPNCALPGIYGKTTPRGTPTRKLPTIEDLGTETIMGVEAQGSRTTTVIPVGEIGNNEPLTRTNETWSAVNPGLRGLTVRLITDDPQNGKFTRELTAFTQGDPDAALFQPPSDYEVVTKEANTGCASGTSNMTAPIPAPVAALE